MANTKKKSIHLPLVVTGYILFSLIVIQTLISTTIPFGILLFNPKVLHYNVAVTLIALTIGAILPVLLGYIIGDHSVKNKSRLSHHFAGMLFGLLAYWVMILPVMFITLPSDFMQDDRNTGLILMNLLPSLGVALVSAILSIAHVRGRHAKQDILGYKPLSGLLIALIITLPVWSVVQNIITNSVNIFTFVPLILVFVPSVISYAMLRKINLNSYEKAAWTAVSVSVLFISMYASELFVSSISNYLIRTPTMEVMSLVSWFGFALALVGWGMYWFKQVKALR